MTKLLGKKKNLSIITQPWFVIIVVISCFGILTPKIFMPLFRQLTNSGRSDHSDRAATNMRMRPMPTPPAAPPTESADFARGSPQFGRPAPTHGTTGGSGSKSLLTFLLPVYATGIGIYMVYTLFKVFNKTEEEKKPVDEEEDFETNKKNNFKFLEKNLNTNVRWDADEGEFKFINKSNNHFNRSEESDDENNDYERYKNLDPDYVEFLKEKRRVAKEEAKKASLASTTKASLQTDEIPLSPGSGITSITNTNVLMNDTLERMKYSLNKINNQLIDVEKKGGPLDDPELENLRFQLTQTEMQMAKIMNIVNNVSSTIQDNYAKTKIVEEEEEELNDEDDIEDLHRQVELIKQVVNKTSKRSKNKTSNNNVYEKIKLNISAAEQLLRKRRIAASTDLKHQIEVDKYINDKLNETASKPYSSESSSSLSDSASSHVSSNQQSDCEKEHVSSNETDEDNNDEIEDNDDECESEQSSDNEQETLNSEETSKARKDKNV